MGEMLTIDFYNISQKNDDTLRVAMIGDSWAFMHHESQFDTLITHQLETATDRPVKMTSKGKCGEITREIYKSLFRNEYYGVQNLIQDGLDYCIISAGINDAIQNLGSGQYCYHYKLILEFLIQNGICPIIIEFPDVNIWKVHEDKPERDSS